MQLRKIAILSVFLLAASGLLAGCGSWFEYDKPTAEKQAEQKERDAKTREDIAKATENAKPIVQEAGKKLGEAARSAAETAKAAAQGVREGWERGKNAPVDLNTASVTDLTALPGISPKEAKKIVAGRPYKRAHDVVSAGILTEDEYARISDAVVAR